MKTIQRQDIALSAALFMGQAAIKKAEELQCYISIVVIDSAGCIKALLSMDKAGEFSIHTCERKAYSALLGLSTKDLGTALDSVDTKVRDSLLSSGKISLLDGGHPIMVENQLVGALGVGGATTEQDEACALYALDALNSL